MENATKALLIAAGVLIVIVIVALGVKILGGAGDTGKSAEQVGKEISSATAQAALNLKLQNYELIKSAQGGTLVATNGSNLYMPINLIKNYQKNDGFEYGKKYLISIGSVTNAIHTENNQSNEFNEFNLNLLIKNADGDPTTLKFAGDDKYQAYELKANCENVQYVEITLLDPEITTWTDGKNTVNDGYLDLALYCGIPGSTQNNTIKFNDIKIYKEK